MSVLDTAKVKELRLGFGMSQRELSRRLGVSASTVDRIERGLSHDDLTLGQVAALAGILGTDVAALVADRDAASREPTEDAALLAAVLTENGKLMTRTQIGRALDWPLNRVDHARRALASSLAGTGLRLHTGVNTMIGIRADLDALTDEQKHRAIKAKAATQGLRSTANRLLQEAITNGAVTEPDGNDNRVGLGELLNQGLLVKDAKGYVPGETVRYALEFGRD